MVITSRTSRGLISWMMAAPRKTWTSLSMRFRPHSRFCLSVAPFAFLRRSAGELPYTGRLTQERHEYQFLVFGANGMVLSRVEDDQVMRAESPLFAVCPGKHTLAFQHHDVDRRMRRAVFP